MKYIFILLLFNINNLTPNIMIKNPNKGHTPVLVYKYVSDLAKKYETAFKAENLGSCDLLGISENYKLVWMPKLFVRRGSIPKNAKTLLVYGQISYKNKVIMVGYRNNLEKTALGHELGHMWLGECYGINTEEGLKNFATKHNLPYRVK